MPVSRYELCGLLSPSGPGLFGRFLSAAYVQTDEFTFVFFALGASLLPKREFLLALVAPEGRPLANEMPLATSCQDLRRTLFIPPSQEVRPTLPVPSVHLSGGVHSAGPLARLVKQAEPVLWQLATGKTSALSGSTDGQTGAGEFTPRRRSRRSP